ncbi:P-loop containing nucleoside triphosphate hydrolase protein [Punctularia strigosozonata HHB-11173 SS5]|uniref:P-loop containing nucleoside triphosphate hydrolase protein n=1 Tax=Punctularia strigosozonata (strain HHB-11173) TaxID=741275 RepID=UPI0004416B82|nr:P-loop containing nucleoside triphosphate hydrolase protein [Punctularia strigosozonata HHB-11173 SS5]EIN07170.1 P-loop containing nucleoside triphosphate hydrolase protein [Punctularia strigosozonata HHB-11173 SS5]
MDRIPPPPTYDVAVKGLSIAVPPYKAYIPTPIPIPIPGALIRWQQNLSKANNDASQAQSEDGLIVRNVNAQVNAGEMMAIIGGSGSGKTTLLHAIASKLNGLPIASGSVLVTPHETESTGNPRGGEGHFRGMSKILGFVRQNDYLLPHLTVRETLAYAASLRLPVSVDAQTRRLIVEQTIQELGLAETADTLIGGSGRKGISGGEKRRVSIGCVLVSLPSVLVLDEVTTGLDSFTAFQLLETLHGLARHGRTIILSLHQPRSDAFPLFSKLLLLSHGSVVYSGETKECLPHFASLGLEPQDRTNPLDFLIDISSVDYRDDVQEQQSRERVTTLIRRWRETEVARHEKEEQHGRGPLYRQTSAGSLVLDANSDHHAPRSSTRRPHAIKQALILLPRAGKNMIRGYPELFGHLTQAVVLGLLVGITFFQLGGNPADIQSLKTLCFQHMAIFYYMTQVVWLFKWCTTLVVYDRERDDGLYSSSAWLFSEMVAWMPVNIAAPSIYAIMVYFICNMRRDNLAGNLGVFVAENILQQMCFVVWALFAASMERSFARASLLGNGLAIFFILSTGFFLVNVPGWIRWFRWLSPFFFGFRIVALSQFRGRQFDCAGITGSQLAQCNGDSALRSLRISPGQPIYPMFLGLLGFFVVVLGISLVILTFWKPGGVRHARRVASHFKGKDHAKAEIDLMRTSVEVKVDDTQLRHVRRVFPSGDKVETPILDHVSATFRSGELSCIMGPSGSGKSTLLRMISGRPMKSGPLSTFVPGGTITFNGEPISHRNRHLCAFVEQDDDYHMPALTVRETLRYAAILKLPKTVSRKRKLARAEEVLKMLGLRDCANGMVGGELLKGISGGEKRRLSLACEMINDPAVLVVDEPTSGLDSYTARNVMEVLREIARSGRTVIVSLHQPRSDIFQMADNVMLLAKHGRVVYQGARDQIIPHFAVAGFVCPPLFNPPDYFLDIISVDVRSDEKQGQTRARVENLIQYWRNHEAKAVEGSPEPEVRTTKPEDTVEQKRQERSPIYIALPVVLERSFRNAWRLQDIFWTRLIQAPFLAICFFIFFLRLTKGPPGAQDRIGIVAESTSAIPFVGFLNLAALYPMEKTVFFHDYRSAGGGYSSATFITSFSIFAIVPELLAALLYAVIINVATGMQTNARIYFEFAIGIWAQLNFGESIGIMFASFFDTMGLSVSLVSVFLTIASQTSGVFSASIAQFLDDIAWIFPMKYSARVLLTNEMRGLTFHCTEQTIQSGVCVAATGQQVLDLFDFHDSTWKLTIIMVAVTVGYRLLAWLVLALR